MADNGVGRRITDQILPWWIYEVWAFVLHQKTWQGRIVILLCFFSRDWVMRRQGLFFLRDLQEREIFSRCIFLPTLHYQFTLAQGNNHELCCRNNMTVLCWAINWNSLFKSKQLSRDCVEFHALLLPLQMYLSSNSHKRLVAKFRCGSYWPPACENWLHRSMKELDTYASSLCAGVYLVKMGICASFSLTYCYWAYKQFLPISWRWTLSQREF